MHLCGNFIYKNVVGFFFPLPSTMCGVPPKDVQNLCSLVLATELCATLRGQVAVRSLKDAASLLPPWQCRDAAPKVWGCLCSPSLYNTASKMHAVPLQDLYWIMDVVEP